MVTMHVEGLADRLDRLEHQNSWLKRLVALSLILTSVLAMSRAGLGRPAKRVEAEQFVVKDSQGNTRALLGIGPDGQPLLTMLDDKGRDQVELGVTYDLGSSLVFRNRGRTRVAMSSATSGYAGLSLYNDYSETAAGLYMQPDREAGLVMKRGDGEVLIGLDREGTSQFRMADPDGTSWSGLPVWVVDGVPAGETDSESPTGTIRRSSTDEVCVPSDNNAPEAPGAGDPIPLQRNPSAGPMMTRPAFWTP